MSPAGAEHGRVAFKLGLLLGNHVLPRRLGAVYAAETGFLLSRNPDTVRAPDVAFVSQARLDQLRDRSGFLPLAPDLAGEVVSPTDSFFEVEEKALAWIEAGSSAVLVVDPRNRRVHFYRSASRVEVLDDTALLDAGDVVAGWQVPVRELFD